MSWAPNPQFLADLENLLLTAASGAGAHKQALDQIESLKANPEYYNYCAAILGNPASNAQARVIAGAQVKNGIAAPAANSLAVKDLCMAAVGDAEPSLRKMACGIVSRAVCLDVWPATAVVQDLCNGLGSQNEPLVRGCVHALHEIVDENIERLDIGGGGAPPLAPTVAGALLPFIGHADPTIQRDALGGVSVLMEQAAFRREGATYDYMGTQLQTLLGYVGPLMMTDGVPVKPLCLATQIVYYSLAYVDIVGPMVPNIVDAVIKLAAHADEEVRTEVVCFFKVLVETQLVSHVNNYVPNILQYLLDSLIYSRMELGMLKGSENDWQEPDKPEDVRPKNFQLRAKRAGGDDDGDDEDDMDVDQWNLRKAAGQTLLAFAESMGDAMLQHVLNCVAERLNGNDWMYQESAIMALGIMAHGCEGLNQYLASIIDRLLNMLEAPDTYFLVKCMCCWTLEQHAEWILTSDESKQAGYVGRAMNNILACMQAPSKVLQTRAICALGSFAGEVDGDELDAFIGPILATLGGCFEAYQMKNLYMLFENVEAVYNCFGRKLAAEEHFAAMTAPLMKMWTTVANDSPLIFPFFMAMSAACSALGAAMESSGGEIFNRAVGMSDYHLKMRLAAAAQGADMPDLSQEFLVAGLDLLSGICEALGGGIEPHIADAGPEAMLALLSGAGSDPCAEIQQSTVAVVGELCSNCIGFVQTQWATFAPLILSALCDQDHHHVASNGAWALCEYLDNYVDGSGLPVIDQTQCDGFLTRLCPLLAINDEDTRTMQENVAIAIARISNIDPTALTRQQVPSNFVGMWCAPIADMDACSGKEAAVTGLFTFLQGAPQYGAGSIKGLLDVCASLPDNIPPEVKQQVTQVMATIKQGAPGPWQQALQGYSAALGTKLRRNFGFA